MITQRVLTSVEICTGAGGQALGLEKAGFEHVRVVEIEPAACQTLELNRGSAWPIEQGDVRAFDGKPYEGVDLFAGGVPCPPFSIAGKQLGEDDSRDLFPAALRLVGEIKPTAVMLENVPGLATRRFDAYRRDLRSKLTDLGYTFVDHTVLNARDFGVPQLRPRFVLVALRGEAAARFRWPTGTKRPPSVGEVLVDLMSERGWPGALAWAAIARGIAPTLVGGSKLHGGPDLGPTRAKAAWRQLGVDAMGVANDAPNWDFPIDAMPKLTVRMAARLQGFDDAWQFSGRKTAAYRQVGNAFPPPVAEAVGQAIRSAIIGQEVVEPEGVESLLRAG